MTNRPDPLTTTQAAAVLATERKAIEAFWTWAREALKAAEREVQGMDLPSAADEGDERPALLRYEAMKAEVSNALETSGLTGGDDADALAALVLESLGEG